MSGTDPALEAGLMAGKRGLDRSNAAFDMKSLGRHIEAVSVWFGSLGSGFEAGGDWEGNGGKVARGWFVRCGL